MWFVDYLGRRGDEATPTRFRERSGSDSKRPSQAGMECDPEHHEVYNDSFTRGICVSIPFCSGRVPILFQLRRSVSDSIPPIPVTSSSAQMK